MSEPNYTDEQMAEAAQISYFDFRQDILKDYQENHDGEYPTVKEYMTYAKDNFLDAYPGLAEDRGRI